MQISILQVVKVTTTMRGGDGTSARPAYPPLTVCWLPHPLIQRILNFRVWLVLLTVFKFVLEMSTLEVVKVTTTMRGGDGTSARPAYPPLTVCWLPHSLIRRILGCG